MHSNYESPRDHIVSKGSAGSCKIDESGKRATTTADLFWDYPTPTLASGCHDRTLAEVVDDTQCQMPRPTEVVTGHHNTHEVMQCVQKPSARHSSSFSTPVQQILEYRPATLSPLHGASPSRGVSWHDCRRPCTLAGMQSAILDRYHKAILSSCRLRSISIAYLHGSLMHNVGWSFDGQGPCILHSFSLAIL